jgi:hypothetical protein
MLLQMLSVTRKHSVLGGVSAFTKGKALFNADPRRADHQSQDLVQVRQSGASVNPAPVGNVPQTIDG